MKMVFLHLHFLKANPLSATLLHLSVVFLVRHWLIAILNAGLTALLGLGLVHAASRWPFAHFSPLARLRQRRLVLLAALTKGAFYLVQGTAAHNTHGLPFAAGFQFPDPLEVPGLGPWTLMSVWRPTAATALVSLLVIGTAASLLLRRAYQMIDSQRALEAFVKFSAHPAQSGVDRLLQQAAEHLGLPPQMRLPPVVLAQLDFPTPLLLGIWRPCILLAPRVLRSLSPEELELALRHELAHFQRHDHWWHWLTTWLEDVGQLNLLSSWLGTSAQQTEEELCDRLAVQSAQEASVLANAIVKSTASSTGQQEPGEEKPVTLPLPQPVVPFLQGRHTQPWKSRLLQDRLAALLHLAQELSIPTVTSAPNRTPFQPLRTGMRQASRFLFGLLLFLILYVKFQLLIGNL